MTDKPFIFGERVRWIGTEFVGNFIGNPIYTSSNEEERTRVVFEQGIYDVPTSKLERVTSRCPTWKEMDDLKAKINMKHSEACNWRAAEGDPNDCICNATICVSLKGLREKIATAMQDQLDGDMIPGGTIAFSEYFGERAASSVIELLESLVVK